jgi:hypothetical protein
MVLVKADKNSEAGVLLARRRAPSELGAELTPELRASEQRMRDQLAAKNAKKK